MQLGFWESIWAAQMGGLNSFTLPSGWITRTTWGARTGFFLDLLAENLGVGDAERPLFRVEEQPPIEERDTERERC